MLVGKRAVGDGLQHTRLIAGSLSGNEDFDGMAGRLLEMAGVLSSFVGKDGLLSADLVQGNGVLLDYFDGHRLGSGKVPDLLAVGLCFLEGARNRSSINVLLGLAQVEALGNNLARRLAADC